MKRRLPSTLFISLAVLIAAVGCSKRSRQSIGGSYSIEFDSAPNYLSEPGAQSGSGELVYRNGDKVVVVSRHPGPYYFLGNENSFSYHVYGDVLVYNDYQPERDSRYRLLAFSPTHGELELEPDFRQYWKVVADDAGITCHRLQGGEKKDDPHPKTFTAESLKAL